jgi:hypothetical protein
MKPIPFDSQKDLAPFVFDIEICRLAKKLKQQGLPWQPHVGCFVWDPDEHIKGKSPFPHRIYFILSLSRFIDIFGSIRAIGERLVWLPTWHQAWLLCQQLGVPDQVVSDIWRSGTLPSAGEELGIIYKLIIGVLKE